MFPLISSAIVTPSSASDIGKTLTQQYRSTPRNCGGKPLRPAFMCSGIMLRGTMPSTQYHSWNPSPNSEKSGGISFSYLRADSNFGKLAYGYKNGFILYPGLKAPSSMVSPRVLCMFPVDADTDQRNNYGCGLHPSFPYDSGECGQLGITNSSAWLRHYTYVPSGRRRHECGFELYQRNYAASMFEQSLYAQQGLGREGFNTQNEMRLTTWAQDSGNVLPIQAFFYIEGGLDGARYDQKDYYNVTGRVVPIVKMTLPKYNSKKAKFDYYSNDQTIRI